MRAMKGTVAKFNAKRGFGFIRSEQLDDEIFVHVTKVDGRRALRPGQDVTFDVEKTDKGLAAVNVIVKGEAGTAASQGKPATIGLDQPQARTKMLLIAAVVVVLIIVVSVAVSF